jgi:formylglycine-generating enzyme required for sulfatase activity
VKFFPPNGYGLYEVCGNVWEWPADCYAARHEPPDPAKSTCCAADSPRGPSREGSYDPGQSATLIPRKVVKGGSFLCAPSYCRRFRPAARHAQMIDTGMSHIGFRCIRRHARREA